MRNILVDTNILLAIDQYGFSIDELSTFGSPVVISSVLLELRRISRVGGKDGRAADLALQIIEKLKIPIIETSGNADDALIRCATESGDYIATLDKELCRRAKSAEIEVLGLSRGKIGLI